MSETRRSPAGAIALFVCGLLLIVVIVVKSALKAKAEEAAAWAEYADKYDCVLVEKPEEYRFNSTMELPEHWRCNNGTEYLRHFQ